MQFAYMQLLLDAIRNVQGVNAGDVQFLSSKAARLELAAGEVYIREGSTSRKLAFIEKGIIRTSTVKDNGDEVTMLLRWEGQFVASHDAIIRQRPSRFTYSTLEPVSILEMDYGDLEKIMAEEPRFEPLRTFFLMKMLAESLELVETFVLYSPEERYRRLVREKPDIISRVPGKFIASMLGITPVSLSRIRKRIVSRARH
ncbi:Crp/Fnr family transcriptional regulator [Chitinophaga sp. XS-30]|nr:Crp/Fnr family transcriptional regulator [Chitinophaga sp. XS-30]